ncbi:hypothetical protein [Massilia aquatica]|uniref:Uncharacterized protein n=1 Tax=Massilia aquatica TaxID=2609000 RepID=A0ABX0M6W8_9BURK|nr:hypothetical protein [Massilia aquatica]NHZ40102.1 hypothetical protein [Massilia aquatica]
MLNTPTKLTCNTCAHKGFSIIFAIFDPSLQQCYRPGRKIDLVTGEPEDAWCNLERRADCRCGPAGRFHSDAQKEDAPC